MQLDGKIIAPTNREPWGSGILQWLQFTQLKGITIFGKGIVDGQGSVWWYDTGNLPSTKPTVATNLTLSLSFDFPTMSCLRICMHGATFRMQALRFYGSKSVTVTGITILNSARTHLIFDNCVSVQVFDIKILSPGDSPNTDGIHLQNSEDVLIYGSNLACGNSKNLSRAVLSFNFTNIIAS